VTSTEFVASIQGWHDFYLAVAGASAALLGLLFVGVSISLGSLAGVGRNDLRVLAQQAFSNLIYVLVISLTMLVADPDHQGIAIGIGFIALFGLLRAARSVGTVRPLRHAQHRFAALRRLGWTILADVLIGLVAISFFVNSDGRMALILMGAVFVLLVGAADIAWDILVRVTDAPLEG